MATNDTVLIEGILDDRMSAGICSGDRSEVFEHFAFEQVLKNLDLDSDEIRSGMIDGRDDGGFDGVYIFVNGHLLADAEAFIWPKAGAELEIWMMSCKLHSTFKQAVVDKIIATISEVLALQVPNTGLKGSYSQGLQDFRNTLMLAYRKLAPRLKTLSINLAYISTGDSGAVGLAVEARADQAVELTRSMFDSCNCNFHFLGASELIEMHRRVRRFELSLPFIKVLSLGQRYVLLTRLEDYAQFVTDENGDSRRYLFDSNVRDYMGMNQVNRDIMNTLEHSPAADFWWLNNGVTILANAATIVGESIEIEGVQIVNGLQTSDSIYRHFRDGGIDPKQRAILVKVIVTDDDAVRDSIIRATNNQTTVETASLRATDPKQRDIEDILLRHGLFYDRRKNHYQNLGHPPNLIVSPLYAARGFVSLVLKAPVAATGLRQKFMRNSISYSAVFGTNAPLEVWVTIVQSMHATDAYLSSIRDTHGGSGDRFRKSWRQILVLLAVSRLLENCAFSSQALLKFDTSTLTKDVYDDVWRIIDSCRTSHRPSPGRLLVRQIFTRAAAEFGLKNHLAVEARQPFFVRTPGNSAGYVGTTLNDSFIEAVNRALPEQPWKPGVHREIAKQLKCRPSDVGEAIAELVLAGKRNAQKDGVVFAADGSVLTFDPERISEDAAYNVVLDP